MRTPVESGCVGQQDELDGEPAAAEAALWLARHVLGTIDVERFEAWRARDPAHAVAFARALATWESIDRIDEPATPALQTPSRRMLLRAAGVGAVAVLAAGGMTGRAYAWSTATTRIGENRKVRLPDGSMAALNTDSALSWRFSESERSFWIGRGEIAIDLREGPQAIMHNDGRKTLLSPGRFNARLRGDTLDLLVLRGEAKIAPTGEGKAAVHGQPAMADAYQSLLLSSDTTLVRPTSRAQIASMIAWQQGEILFLDATLGTAVEEYNRFLTRKIVIVDPELGAIPVGGRFTSSNPTAFLHAVSAGLGVKVSSSGNDYLLTR